MVTHAFVCFFLRHLKTRITDRCRRPDSGEKSTLYRRGSIVRPVVFYRRFAHYRTCSTEITRISTATSRFNAHQALLLYYMTCRKSRAKSKFCSLRYEKFGEIFSPFLFTMHKNRSFFNRKRNFHPFKPRKHRKKYPHFRFVFNLFTNKNESRGIILVSKARALRPYI